MTAGAFLEGVRVLDLSKLIPGAAAAGLLASLGADVVKVEAPEGDYLRRIPPLAHDVGIMHAMFDAGKRSVAFDPQTAEGRDVLNKLTAWADVVVESGRPGAVERLGVSAPELVANGVIVAHLSAYGRTGPLAPLAAHGLNLDGAAGLATTRPDGGLYTGWMPLGTVGGPLVAAYAVAAALFRRERTGEASEIDVSCAESALIWQVFHGAFLWNGDVEGFEPVDGPPKARYAVYRSSDDRRMIFCAIEPRFWTAFCAAADRPDLAERGEPGADVDFGTHDRWLADELTTLFRSRPFDEWLDLFLAADVPAGPAYEPEDVPDVAHVLARGALRRVRITGGAEIVVPSWPVREAGAEPLPLVDVPGIGQHTAEVLAEAGCSEEEIAATRGTNRR